MKCRTLVGVFSCVILSLGLVAQTRPGGGRPSGSASTPTIPRTTNPNLPTTNPTLRSLFFSGKVAVDDGTPLTDPATIQSNCKGRIRTEGYTDSKGSFSFEISNSRERELAGVDQAIDSAPAGPGFGGSRGNSVREWRECELQAVLPGFTSQVIELASRITDFANADVGTIVLHRLNQVEGFTISATSASAPAKAKKEYEKGRGYAKKEKWDAAQERFQKAVEAYPKYAVAWFELGRMQVQKSDLSAARQSFHQALSADSKFISPYQELANLAVREKQWQELLETTDQLLRLNPVNFPQYWMLNAAANYNLRHFDAAEKSVLQGLRLDAQHHVPKLEYLLGAVLAQRHDYRGAAEHMRNYLQLSPNAPDAGAAQAQVESFEKLSAKATDNK